MGVGGWGDCGRSRAESVSPALVEACQPTQRIRDTNIHRKHSPRYIQMCLCLLTDGTKQSVTRDRQETEEEKEDRGGTTESFSATSKLLMQSNETSEFRRGRRKRIHEGRFEYEQTKENWVRPILMFSDTFD